MKILWINLVYVAGILGCCFYACYKMHSVERLLKDTLTMKSWVLEPEEVLSKAGFVASGVDETVATFPVPWKDRDD